MSVKSLKTSFEGGTYLASSKALSESSTAAMAADVRDLQNLRRNGVVGNLKSS